MRTALLALALLAACQRETPDDDVPRQALALVQADELLGLAPDRARIVVDVRPVEAFAAGHIPGAVRLDVSRLRATVDGVPEQLAPKDTIEAALTELGVDLGDEIVVVDATTSPPAGRLVWTLEHFGHAPERLRVLDGGWPAWLAAGGPESTEPGQVDDGPAPALGAEQPALRVDAAWVLAHLDDPDVLLLDVRSDAEWQAGRIPGALHSPWQAAQTPDGTLLDPTALRDLYARALEAPTVAVYCKSGMRASLTWLVLRLLGHPDVRLYDGSWNEWGARADLPKET